MQVDNQMDITEWFEMEKIRREREDKVRRLDGLHSQIMADMRVSREPLRQSILLSFFICVVGAHPCPWNPPPALLISPSTLHGLDSLKCDPSRVAKDVQVLPESGVGVPEGVGRHG